MSRRRRHLVLVGLLLLLLAAAAAVPSLVQWTVSRRLARQGLVLKQLRWGLRWDGVEIDHAVVAGRGRLAGVRAEVKDARLRTDWADLRRGRLRRADVGALRVALPPQQRRGGAGAWRAVPLPGPWLAKLPVERLALRHLQVHMTVAGVSTVVRGSLEGKQGQWRAAVVVAAPQAPPLPVSGQLGPGGAAVTLGSAAAPMATLTARVIRSAGGPVRLSGDLQAEAKPLGVALAPWLGPVQAEGHVHLQWHGTAPGTAPLTLASVERQGRVEAALDAKLNGQVGRSTLALDLFAHTALESGSLEVAVAPQSRLQGAGLPGFGGRALGPVTVAVPRGLEGRWRLGTPAKVPLQGEIVAALAGALHGRATLSDAVIVPASTPWFDAALALEGGWTKAAPLPGRGSAAGKGDLSWDGAALHVDLDKGAALTVRSLRLGSASVGRLQATLARAVSGQVQPANGHWQVGAAKVAVEAAQVAAAPITLRRGRGTVTVGPVTGQGGRYALDGRLSAPALRLEVKGQALPPLALQAEGSAQGGEANGHFHLALPQQVLRVDGQWHQALDKAAGGLTAGFHTVQFAAGAGALQKRLAPWPAPFDLTDGSLSGSGALAWNRGGLTRRSATLHLVHLGGRYRRNLFDNLTTTIALAGATRLHTVRPARVRLKKLDAGVAVSDIDFTAALEPAAGTRLPQVVVRGLSADLLGGHAHSKLIRFDPSRTVNRFTLYLDHLNVAAITALERQHGLDASGLLDGELPFRLSRAGIAIDSGLLRARSPGGEIRYLSKSAEALAKRNPAMAIALKALRNFHYHVLDAHVNYLPDGTLHLRVKLQGRNPNFNAGQPINLNISIEENVPILLRSLSLGNEISGAIERRIEERLQQNGAGP